MNSVPELDFQHIAPRCGSKDDAFEELCCQLALESVNSDASFRRIRGAGGDGGVECIWTDAAGGIHGWQVKYIFDYGRAFAKVKASFEAARARYPGLVRYVICLPFDLSGSRGNGGRSQHDKFDTLKSDLEAVASAAGQSIAIELWSSSTLQKRLLDVDEHGGRVRYWFDAQVLGQPWFEHQVDAAVLRAGPRYSAELHTGHALDEATSALGGGSSWDGSLQTRQSEAEEASSVWSKAVASSGIGVMGVAFPETAKDAGKQLADALCELVVTLAGRDLVSALSVAKRAQSISQACEGQLAQALDDKYGRGSSDSVSFRQFQAEYQCTFPARHLDDCRSVHETVGGLLEWLETPAVRASSERVLLLTGPAGIGKTHGLCDAVKARLATGLPTLLLTGRQFDGDRTVWESIIGALGLGVEWSGEMLLDALNSAGTEHRVLLCMDALDERTNR